MVTVGGPAPRLALARLALALLALSCLGGCQKAEQVGAGVGKARDCATVLKAIANLNLDPQSVARAAGRAQDTAQRLDDVARGLDQSEVRQAAETLAGKVKALASKANNSSPAQLERQARDATAAAAHLASTCNVPLDQVVSGG